MCSLNNGNEKIQLNNSSILSREERKAIESWISQMENTHFLKQEDKK